MDEKPPPRKPTILDLQLETNLPIFVTPLTRFGQTWQTRQTTHCAPFEMDYMRCASRVGRKGAETQCWKYWEDFLECTGRNKAINRYHQIEKQRKKKGSSVEPPPADAIQLERERCY